MSYVIQHPRRVASAPRGRPLVGTVQGVEFAQAFHQSLVLLPSPRPFRFHLKTVSLFEFTQESHLVELAEVSLNESKNLPDVIPSRAR